MTSAEKFDFNAPQFFEPLTNNDEVDDGADKFFDAVDENKSKEGDQNEEKLVVATQNDESESQNIETESHDTAPVVSCNDNAVSDEAEGTTSVKKMGRPSRLSKMFKNISSPLRRSARFTSLAEQVHKFHHATPPRFKRKSGASKSRSQILPTIAHSPLLQTKSRARPSTVPTVGTEERPVWKVVKASKKQAKPPPKPAPKPATVPQPFNLTDPSRFKKAPKEDSKTADGTSAVTVKKPVNVKKKTLVMEGDGLAVKEVWAISGMKTLEKTNVRTKIVPFSFEQRNQDLLKAKQKKLEEAKENKPHNFKLPPPKPAPKFRPSSAVGQSDSKKKRLGRPSLQNEEKKLAK